MIRTIQETDAKAIQELCQVALGYDADLNLVQSQIKKLSQDHDHHIIAVYEDKVSSRAVAFVHAEIYEGLYSEAGLNILGLAVSPDYQGQGIGRELMTFIEKYAINHQLLYIRLNSAVHRLDAHQFYQSIGYRHDRTQKRFTKTF
ncbi:MULTISPECIES: GNAT family N-acetyltransferase [Aerococcus]|uniref:GNAT family N-acetyltransferase n=1 Tax=Aerococcus urinae (strain CCUG 59500 / ACS-120-V-Col10a) TaxID=2976812 RepID=UPI000200F3D7|nr:GNAT family N-acetyltransferase [Aerococcus sp. Group 1]AEA01092.1 acetyltransferase, GNAT family [Aerococcus sp. Group 1]MCY3030340.1 GNAT family N-acetyltransferase [Aerococcus sp. Group 1]MCY3055437.1 GNAT family N-acetyltransferase [Aerococcus sp. Group 1]MCY3057167.1 GNAT family N-acetyltransferase [Aerococcus sp. Group 1]MCY3061529.1 GNAT family N-acetyltransferase [Aerococcus sp. Group 1]